MNDRFKPMICGDGFCGATDCARCYPQFIHKPTDEVHLSCPECREEFMQTKQELVDSLNEIGEVTCPECEAAVIIPDVLWE